MAAPSRPYVYPPVLVRRDDPRMAATSVVVGDENENEENMDVGSGGTTGSQQWNADGIGELPPPISSSRPLNSPMSTQDVLPSRSGEPSNPAIPTPADNQETSFQASAAPSSSMNASSTFPLEFVSSTIRPTLTFQADANTMDGMVTIQAASTTTPAFLEDSGAKIENEALPGVNQGDPSLVPVPGMNQETTLLVTAPAVTPLATPESSAVSSVTSAMTVGKPMPGKNQPKPTVDAAVVSFMVLSNSGSTAVPTPSSISSSTESTTIATTIGSSANSFSVPPTLAVSTSSPTASLTATSSSVLPPVLTFVTVTRTAEGKEDAQPSTQTILAPQAVTTPQSLPSALRTLSLTAASTVPSSLATAISVEPQSGLTPLARTLFILFGVLGFVTIVLTIVIVLIMRSNKRRAQAGRTPARASEEYDAYGNTTRVSANSSIRTSLTEPEKAIVNRAATPDGEPDASIRPSNALAEAINSFITKSRRMTYKISP